MAVSVMWICPQKPKILALISFLKPATNDVAISMTATLNATDAVAMRMMTYDSDLLSAKAMRLAMKDAKLM